MKKIEKEFATIEQVENFLWNMCNAYSMVLNQHLIINDAQIDIDHLKRIDRECREYEVESNSSCPYTFWIGLRTRGSEGGEDKEYVKNKIESHGDVVICVFKIEYNGQYIVSYKQKEVKF